MQFLLTEQEYYSLDSKEELVKYKKHCLELSVMLADASKHQCPAFWSAMGRKQDKHSGYSYCESCPAVKLCPSERYGSKWDCQSSIVTAYTIYTITTATLGL